MLNVLDHAGLSQFQINWLHTLEKTPTFLTFVGCSGRESFADYRGHVCTAYMTRDGIIHDARLDVDAVDAIVDGVHDAENQCWDFGDTVLLDSDL